MKCKVKMLWDPESHSWYTVADDVLHLVLSSKSFDALIDRVRTAAPEMLELNYGYTGDIELIFEIERQETLHAVS